MINRMLHTLESIFRAYFFFFEYPVKISLTGITRLFHLGDKNKCFRIPEVQRGPESYINYSFRKVDVK